MTSRAGVRAAPAAVAVALLGPLGCGDVRPASVGSARELGSWAAEARPAAAALDLHPLSLPSDTLSVTVMAESPGGALLSLGVRDPAGAWVVDGRSPEESPNRVLRGHGLVVALLPAASAALPLAAQYQVAPATLEGGTVAATVSTWIKRGPEGRQELPLAVVVVGAAIDEAALDTALGEVGRIWRAGGIEVREPARLRVEGIDAEGLARVEVDAALGNDSPMVAAALRLSARAPADALPLVVVDDVAVAGPGYSIWALSGGVPVPPVNGTGHSGVVVSGVLLRQDPLLAGQVMAHEMGHALGLFHTTEGELVGGSALADQIDDTPACPATADGPPGDGTLTARECEGHDAGNLMFWTAARGATMITPGQAALARRSARVR
jgi:hypothetical protein